MTRIDRESFVSSLQNRPIDLQAIDPVADQLRGAGISDADLNAIAGADHVIQGRAEAEQLYDRLVALESTPAGRQSGTDYAGVIGAAVQTAPPAVDVVTGAGPRAESARPRSTGVLAPPPTLLRSDAQVAGLLPPSDYVRTLGDSTARGYEAAAARNVTGPEAQAQRRIQALTNHAVTDLRGLEAERDRLTRGSAERNAVEDRIDARVNTFESALRAEQLLSGGSRAEGTSDLTSKIKKGLPPYLREAVEREGVYLPGTPGAVAPHFGGAPGFDYRLKF